MKRSLPFILLAFLICISANIHAANPKLSPFTKKFLNEMRKSGLESGMLYHYVCKNYGSQKYLSALIKINGAIEQSDLNNLGIKTGTIAGNIMSVQIPLLSMESFIHLQGIDYIQIDEPAFPTLDSARSATHVDSVHAGIGLSMPYNGEGVIVGVVDAGFDFSSPAFFDTTGTNYRVKKAWLQKNNSGIPPVGYAYGTEIFDSTALWNIGSDNDGTHATHVSGICAGSGFGGPGKRFRGFAYKSDMVCVGITPDKPQWVNTGVSDMIDGINYIFTYADSVDKPAVVNLSWGSPLGPHDGRGLFSVALDNLTGPGKIFVCSAGNNGSDSVHFAKTFTSSDTLASTFLDITKSPEGKKTWVDIWGDSAKTFCAEVVLWNNAAVASTGVVCLDDSTHDFTLLGSNNDTCFISIMTSSVEFNNKPRIFLDFDSRLTDSLADSVLIILRGNDGHINMWNSFVSNTSGYYGRFVSYGHPLAMDGDYENTISDIASSKSAITVGAYCSKVNWSSIDGNSYYAPGETRRDLASFSSRGPTADGRIKPDITGPGLTVASSLSSYDSTWIPGSPYYPFVVYNYHNPVNNRDYPYGELRGTSMSSPAVAGITALMLQADRTLDPQKVKDIFAQTAIKDGFTGVIPPGGNNVWGNGKVNAYRSVLLALQWITSANTISKNSLDCSIYPNPNQGIFTINYSGKNNDELNIEIFDIAGACVYSEKWKTDADINFKQIDIKNLSAGVYITKVTSQQGYSIFKTNITN
jgi:minor extracellular serine protease Vpr